MCCPYTLKGEVSFQHCATNEIMSHMISEFAVRSYQFSSVQDLDSRFTVGYLESNSISPRRPTDRHQYQFNFLTDLILLRLNSSVQTNLTTNCDGKLFVDIVDESSLNYEGV